VSNKSEQTLEREQEKEERLKDKRETKNLAPKTNILANTRRAPR